MSLLPRVIVVEDEAPARSYLVSLLQRSALVEIAGAVADAPRAQRLVSLAEAEELPVDLAFVDVSLGADEHAGLSLAAWLSGHGVATVLTTASREHALRAFELGVVDYLLKPFTAARVSESLTRVGARRRAVARSPARVVARDRQDLVFLERGELRAFEAADRLVFAHTTRGRFDVDLSLAALEELLPEGFLRVHRAWLVAVDHVERLERADGDARLHLRDSELRVPVARERRGEVRRVLLARSVGLRED